MADSAPVRVVAAVLVVFLALFLGDAVAWIAAARGPTGVTAVAAVAAVGAACFAALLAGALLDLLLRAARAGGPAATLGVDLLSPKVSVPAALGAVVLATGAIVLGVHVRKGLLGTPGRAAAYDLGVLVAALVLAGTLLGAGWARRNKPIVGPRTVGVGAGLAALGGMVLGGSRREALIGPGLWDLWVVGVAVLGVVAALALLPGQQRTLPETLRRPIRWTLAAVTAAAVVGATLMQTSAAARTSIAAQVRPATWLMVVGRLVDLDGDGYSPLFGGGDCDDGDPQVNPEAPEEPGNGRDENCRGGDRLAPSPFPPRPSFVPLPAGARPPRHVVLVTIDTLRADHLGLYGYERDTSPRLDAWARDAVVYEHAYAAAPYTRLAMPLIATGRHLSQIPWNRSVIPWGLTRGATTIASVLSKAGVASHGVFAHRFFLRAQNWTEGLRTIDESLIPSYEEGLIASSGPQITKNGLAWLRKNRKKRTFLWLHYYDPHASYQVHPGGPRFGSSPMDRYDGEIVWTDRALGALFDGIRESGLEDDTAIVLLSDHGEEFGEHGGTLHGTQVWQETVHVPLIVRIPGLPGRRLSCPTSFIDVAPTITNLFGIDGGAHGFSGATLLADLEEGGCDPDREAVAELRFEPTHELRALIGRRYKLVQNMTAGTFHLYDLVADPGEHADVRAENAAVFERMKARLLQWTEHVAGEEFATRLAQATVRRLPRRVTRYGTRFGKAIELVGVDLGNRVMTEETAVRVHLYWRVDRTPPRDCQVYLRFMEGRGSRLVIGRKQVPFNDVIPFERFPHDRILVDVTGAAYRGRRSQDLRVRVGVECGGTALPAVGGPLPIIGGRFVDLGKVRAIAGSGRGDGEAP